jgi:predicted phosphoadenosine phosphosulfate sulfurtransferase
VSDLKRPLGVDVLTAARERIAWVFDNFERVCVSFSAGKDSTVLAYLAADEARARGRRFGLLLIDLEAQYAATIEHAERVFTDLADCTEPLWVAVPLVLRNAVSQYEPRWVCWDPAARDSWVRTPPERAITDPNAFPFYTPEMEFEDFVDGFGAWYANGVATAQLVGIRADESLNRFRALLGDRKTSVGGHAWTTWKGEGVFNAYPIYDWRTRDVWIYHGKTGRPYNRVYDLMHAAGVGIHSQRICQPYGDDQRKGLWLFHALEPETWARVVARVNGANSGALYARERGNVNGTIRVALPPGHTWESFSDLILGTLPPATADHYRNKVALFLNWWRDRGYPDGIPDELDPKVENARDAPSWRRVAKTLLRNDWWCKGLSFTQTKRDSYDRYVRLMHKRRAAWRIYSDSLPTESESSQRGSA